MELEKLPVRANQVWEDPNKGKLWLVLSVDTNVPGKCGGIVSQQRKEPWVRIRRINKNLRHYGDYWTIRENLFIMPPQEKILGVDNFLRHYQRHGTLEITQE